MDVLLKKKKLNMDFIASVKKERLT